jgi:hypothetical protein
MKPQAAVVISNSRAKSKLGSGMKSDKFNVPGKHGKVVDEFLIIISL